ncbi:hypothetical protein NZK33_00780 [Cyanobium sp. FGCU-6]|nr:hypothetical protein [Cyanobium sp. FGCU6]
MSDPSLPAPASATPEPAAHEFVAWAAEHQREQRLHAAELAQITEHPDPDPTHDAIGQQQAWARRQEHEKRLHDSAIAQMKPQPPTGP